MRSEEPWNLKTFLKALGLLPSQEREDPAWEIPVLQQLTVAIEVLGGKIGESSKRAVSRRALDSYGRLSDTEKVTFFEQLLDDYEVDPPAVDAAYRSWSNGGGSAELVTLIKEVEPRRQGLLRNLNHADGATLELVSMRADLLRLIHEGHDHLKPLDHDFRHLLSSWFNPGFLDLGEITWEKAKAVSEHLIKYESVHPIHDVGELKKRVHPRDRVIYGFTHPATGDLPLIFVEVAFANGLPTGIDEILKPRQTINPAKADTAVFYSINSSFDGLAGISFGNLLIKRVTQLIQASMPNIVAFTTLSPLPGLRKWLERSDDENHRRLVKELKEPGAAEAETDRVGLEERFVAAAAQYITETKNERGLPIDPVGRFHLGNGATAWRIVWPASTRDYIWEKSFGGMIIYRYEPEKIENQHEDFVRNQKISVSPHFLTPIKRTSREPSQHEQSEVHID